MTLEWINALVAVCGAVAGVGGTMLFKSGRDKARAEADKAIKDNYEERIADLHRSIDVLNETEAKQARRIADLNGALDNKTLRIREVEDRLVVTERENTRLAEENGALKTDMASHRCVIRNCGGRTPANEHTCSALKNGTAVFPSEPSVDVSADEEKAVEKPVKKKSRKKVKVEE